VEDWDELKPEGNSRDLYRKLSQKFKQDSSILIVGHEPYLSSLISEIISEDVTSHVVTVMSMYFPCPQVLYDTFIHYCFIVSIMHPKHYY
jgi:phosphohistidine phosphatase SixA